MRRAQVLERIVDECAAIWRQMVPAQQEMEPVQRRLAPVARVLDGVDGVEAACESHDMQHLFDVVAWCVGEHQLLAAEARKRMLKRVLVHHHVGELGKDVRLAQEMPGIRAMVAHQAVQRGAIAAPETRADLVRTRLVDAEIAPQVGIDLLVHRRKDALARVVQRFAKIEDPHPPRRRQTGDAHCYLLRMSVPTPWSVSTSRSSACGTRPSMMCTLLTPLRAASSAEPIFGIMPPEMTPLDTRSSIFFGVRPVSSLPSLSSTPGVLVRTTSFSARSTSASLPATRSALML